MNSSLQRLFCQPWFLVFFFSAECKLFGADLATPFAMITEISSEPSVWKFTVRNLRKTYEIDEPIIIETITTNGTEQAQRFLRGYRASDFRASIIGPDGKRSELLTSDAENHLPLFYEGKLNIRPVSVKPNSSYQQAFQISERMKFSNVGVYRISMSRYCGPVLSVRNQQLTVGKEVFTGNTEFEIRIVQKTAASIENPSGK